MKISIISTFVYTLISIIVFSIVFSNAYALFIDNQDDMFIEDIVVVKVLDGEKYYNTESIIKHLESEGLSYVVYYKKGDVFHVKKNNYYTMINLAMTGDEINEQEIGRYKYKPLNYDENLSELFIAVKDYDVEKTMMLFDGDGSFGMKNIGYNGMISIELYLILLTLIFVINYLFLFLYLYVNKEKVGVMKLLGYSSEFITKKIVRKIACYFLISTIFVFLLNKEYITHMLQHYFVFKESINLLIIYVASLTLVVFISGAITYTMIERNTVVKYLREVTYD